MGHPTDTAVDRIANLSAGAATLMKAIYLSSPQASVLREQGMSDSDIVNGMEELRQAGLLEVVYDEHRDRYRISLVNQAR